MKISIDTNAYSSANRGDEDTGVYFTTKNQLYVPIVVIGELKAGFEHGTQAQHNREKLDSFLSQVNTDILHVTEKTAQLYANIFAALRKIGCPINTNDIWIAALCIENDLPLLTKDQDFKYILGLKLVI
jgi:tRNA(fMet)-specific endonuclease VapC